VFHLWPRGNFTLIALANRDRTFTVTIFAPFQIFEEELMHDEKRRLSFFHKNFPDVIDLLGEKHIVDTFNRLAAPLPLVSIKCAPHSFFKGRVLLMGDAAHAMVPFYGQGMNAGFEDCLVLNEILEQFGDDIGRSAEHYSSSRCKDAHTINDLAMYNYKELKDLVNKIGYKLRKQLDLFLNSYLPNAWIPLYSMVTFTRIPYSEVVKRRAQQDAVSSNAIAYDLQSF
jgi:kynurenine 3-monooxygenase